MYLRISAQLQHIYIYLCRNANMKAHRSILLGFPDGSGMIGLLKKTVTGPAGCPLVITNSPGYVYPGIFRPALDAKMDFAKTRLSLVA